MRKLLMWAITISIVAVQGCEGPMGPQGPQGQDGGIITSSAFELEVDFTNDNNYEVTESYGFDVLPFDVTLVYILWEADGKEIWRLLPQSVFFDDGVLQYNYDFTDVDVRIFLEGNINLGTLDTSWLQDQVFRIVVVPADNVGRLDYSDYEGVTRMLGLKDSDFQKR